MMSNVKFIDAKTPESFKLARTLMGKSQKELSVMFSVIGISLSHIRAMERGEIEITSNMSSLMLLLLKNKILKNNFDMEEKKMTTDEEIKIAELSIEAIENIISKTRRDIIVTGFRFAEKKDELIFYEKILEMKIIEEEKK